MDITDIITNPIVIGLLAGLITYIYMRWRNNKNKDKKKRKDINLLIPFSVFVVFWFISYAYFSSLDEDATKSTPANNIINVPENTNNVSIKIKPSQNLNTNQKLSDTSEPVSFNLVSKSNGVHIPDNLPDILFEMN
jgi:D-alanyl-lipoteichoic acid acyltransferase DltB (MBOAT superfamily)